MYVYTHTQAFPWSFISVCVCEGHPVSKPVVSPLNQVLFPSPPSSSCSRDLMSSCWAQNPDKRPTFSEIMSILDNQLSAAHVSVYKY